MSAQKPWERSNAPTSTGSNPWDRTTLSTRDDDADEIERKLEDDGPGFWGTALDVGQGIVAGGVDAIVETAISAKNFISYASEQSARRELEADGIMSRQGGPDTGKVQGLRETQVQVSAENAADRRLLDESIRAEKQVFKETAGIDPDTALGKFAEDVTRFLVPYTKLAKLTGASTIASRAVVSGTVAMTAVDPYEEGVANLIQDQPALANPVTEYLAVKPGDSEGAARAKKLIEDVILGVTFDGVIEYAPKLYSSATKAITGALDTLKARRVAQAAAKDTTPTVGETALADAKAVADEAEVARKVDAAKPTGVADEAEARGTFAEIDVTDSTRYDVEQIDGRYTLAVSKAGGVSTIYLDEAGKSGAYIQFTEVATNYGPAEWRITSAVIDSDWRGRGFGTEMYDRLIRAGAERGALIVSDTKVSADAQRVWASLEKHGHGVTVNEQVEREASGRLVSLNGEPVYRLQAMSETPVRTGGSTARGAVSVAAVRRPGAAKLIKAAIESGRAGSFGRTVRAAMGLSETPAAGFTEAGTRLKMSAYNESRIDWSSLGDDPTDARAILRAAEEAVSEIAEKAGTARVSFEATGRQADEIRELLGPQAAAEAFEATRGLSPKLLAAHGVLMDALGYAQGLASALKEPGATDEMRRDLVQAVEMYQALHAEVRGATSEAARALANLRQMKKARETGIAKFADIARELGHDPDAKALVEKLAGGMTPTEISKELTKTPQRRALEAALELFYSSILSSPKTWIVNTFSSLANLAVHIPERATAAGLGKLREVAGTVLGRDSWRTGEGALWVEVKGQIVGAGMGFKVAGKAMLAPFKEMAGGNLKPAQWGEAYRAELATVWGDAIPVSQVDLVKRQAIRIEIPDEPAKDFMDRSFRGMAHVVNAFGSSVRAVGGIIKTTDDLVRVVAHEQERYARAYAELEWIKRGSTSGDRRLFGEVYSGDDAEFLDAFLNARRVKGSTDPFEDYAAQAADEAATYAQDIVFQREPGAWGQWIQGGLNKFPAMRFILPFYRTPANLFRWGFLERSPLGLLTRDIRQQLADPGRVGDIARARMLIGTVVVGETLHLASAVDEDGNPKYLTGGRTKGLNSEDYDRVPPYSVKIGGKWVSYQRLDPFGMPLGMAADIVESLRRMDDSGDAALLDATKAIIFAAAKNSMSKTWLQGISTFLSAMEDPDRNGDQLLKQLAGGMVPFSSLLRNATGSHDEYAREAFGIIEKLQAQLPGRESLPVKRDWLGEPVKSKDYVGPDFLSPIEAAKQSDDPLNRELARLRFGYSMPDKKLEGVKLTSVEYSRLLEIRGTLRDPVTGLTLREAATALVARKDYQSYDDDTQVELLKKLVNAYGREAGARFKAEQKSAKAEDSWFTKLQKQDAATRNQRESQLESRQ